MAAIGVLGLATAGTLGQDLLDAARDLNEPEPCEVAGEPHWDGEDQAFQGEMEVQVDMPDSAQ